MPTSEEFITQIHEHMNAGRKIEAIKMVRHLTGLGLKEAKELVERDLDSLKPENYDEIEPMPEHGGCGAKAAALLLAVIGLLCFS